MPDRYSSGHFAAVAFFALVALIAFTFGGTYSIERFQREQAERAARQHSVYADEHIERACVGLYGSELTVCAQEQVERSREYQNAEYDLAAQESMALYAKWLLWVSIASVGMTGLGVFFVWQTLNASKDATEAAMAAVAVTREIGQAQVRAYLKCSEVKCKYLGEGTEFDVFSIYVAVKNYGQSPAFRVVTKGTIALFDNQNEMVSDPSEMGSDLGDIAPQGDASMMLTATYPHGTAEFIQSMDGYLGIEITLSFEDVFGSKDINVSNHISNGRVLKAGVTAAAMIFSKKQKAED